MHISKRQKLSILTHLPCEFLAGNLGSLPDGQSVLFPGKGSFCAAIMKLLSIFHQSKNQSGQFVRPVSIGFQPGHDCFRAKLISHPKAPIRLKRVKSEIGFEIESVLIRPGERGLPAPLIFLHS